jgi:hypothetical protein
MANGVVIKDANWKRLMRNLKHIDRARVHVGVLQNEKAEGDNEDGFDLVALAATQEYGSIDGHTPSRPFLRSTFRGPPQWLVLTTSKLAKPVLEGKLDIDRALGLLGAVAATKVKETITSGAGVPPPNAPSTIAKKGSDRPLVDTGRLLNSISWRVFLDGGATE